MLRPVPVPLYLQQKSAAGVMIVGIGALQQFLLPKGAIKSSNFNISAA